MNHVTWLAMWLSIHKILTGTDLLSFTNIQLSPQGKNKHICSGQDKFSPSSYVKTRIALLKIKFKSILMSYPLSMKTRLYSGWTLFTLFCHRTVAKFINVNCYILFGMCYLSLGRFMWYFTYFFIHCLYWHLI